jgi:sodium-dependent dicarboxylate transporter 2/3/5
VGLPIAAVMMVALVGLLAWLHPAGKTSGDATADLQRYLQRQRAELGGWTRGQVNTLVAFGLAVVLWILPGVLTAVLGSEHAGMKVVDTRLPEAVVAVLAAALLFVLPVNFRENRWTLSWEEAAKIDWGTILLFGGGMSLGLLMEKLGVARALGDAVIHGTGVHDLWALTAVAIGLAIAITELMSNTAAATMLMPVVIGIALAAKVSPAPPAIGACLGASFAFMLPVSTPPNAIVFGSGLVPITRMVRAGVLLDLVGLVVIWAGLRVLCPLVGLV